MWSKVNMGESLLRNFFYDERSCVMFAYLICHSLVILLFLIVYSAKLEQEEYIIYAITKLFYENILQDSVHDLRFSIVCHFGNLLKETNKQNQERYHAG